MLFHLLDFFSFDIFQCHQSVYHFILSILSLQTFLMLSDIGIRMVTLTPYVLFRGTSLAGHKHLMHLVEQQFQLHCSGSSAQRDTASLSAVGGLAREVIACGPV